MEDLINFAFTDLIARLDVFSIWVPRTITGLSQSCEDLENILRDYQELVHFVEMALSLSED